MALQERFEANYIKNAVTQCWEWTAGKDNQGHGIIKDAHVTYQAHRIAYQLYIGTIPNGLCALHSCGSVSCVNPNHLYLGTQKDINPKTLKERFEERYTKETPDKCWEWVGGKNDCGYGQIEYHGRRYYAHRLSYQFHNGEIQKGMFICHHCDNPGCVNPSHLFAGTAADNSHDCLEKGRIAKRYGERNGKSKLTDGQVKAIRERQKEGVGYRSLAESFGVSESYISRLITLRRREVSHESV